MAKAAMKRGGKSTIDQGQDDEAPVLVVSKAKPIASRSFPGAS